MAVLVEGTSVIVRRSSISQKMPGGWSAFVSLAPNSTMCADDDLARVGFLELNEAQAFVERLEAEGLVFLSGGQAVDIAILDQHAGLTIACDWLEFTRIRWGKERDSGHRVGACWLWDQPRVAAGIHMPAGGLQLATPAGWKFEGSLSHQLTFSPDPTRRH